MSKYSNAMDFIDMYMDITPAELDTILLTALSPMGFRWIDGDLENPELLITLNVDEIKYCFFEGNLPEYLTTVINTPESSTAFWDNRLYESIKRLLAVLGEAGVITSSTWNIIRDYFIRVDNHSLVERPVPEQQTIGVTDEWFTEMAGRLDHLNNGIEIGPAQFVPDGMWVEGGRRRPEEPRHQDFSNDLKIIAEGYEAEPNI